MTLFNILRNLCFTLPIIFMIKNEKKLKHEIKYYFIIRNFTLLFIILMIISEKFEIIGRFNLYFSFFYTICLTNLLEIKKYKRILIFFILILTLRYYIVFSTYPFIKNYRNIIIDIFKEKYISIEERISQNNKEELAKEHFQKKSKNLYK